ncbi:hypothetical protein [Microbacterium sp. 13-71-7]|jgi:hypothetical protein|uniref:hypothetical protein n=1 Tax=Microbacterium sp. 13-71-7 TaxID=1970399 RepID=UPI000BC9C8DF|nr:hypothetical protein [Microbacterium sp. 13-71-7]OZB80869.1 MAG: hypothetical protein B7X32_18350 [Microbacterium sp. 13-71-7]
MSAVAAPTAAPALPGRTTVTARALHRLGVGIVASASGADPREVALRWDDANGGLHATVTLPLPLPLRPGIAAGRTIEEQGADLRASLVTGMAERAGRSVSRVDLRFAGVRREETRRVR